MTTTLSRYEWLQFIYCIIPDDTQFAMREFVTGMHERDLIYHWDDDPADCLDPHHDLVSAEIELIRKIVDELYCEDMFTLAIQLRNDQVN